MNIYRLIEMGREGTRNLLRHKIRSGLTIMGIVFGVAAVIAMLAIGEGGQKDVMQQIEGLGINNIIVDSTKPTASHLDMKSEKNFMLKYGPTLKDVEQVRGLFPDGRVSIAHLVDSKVYFHGIRQDAKVWGVDPDYFMLFHTELQRGKSIADIHNVNQYRVAVITEQLANDLPAINGPIGQTVNIGNYAFEIIGVVRMPDPERGLNRQIFIPYKTAKQQFGCISYKVESGSEEMTRTEMGRFVLQLPDIARVSEGSRVIERIMNQNHPSHDFILRVPIEELKAKQKIQRTWNAVLIAIAAISLLVGGIGIMNVMLAIVMERVPEIGIRRAVGASQFDILWQFLAEAVVLSTAGGILGCLLGVLAVPLASYLTGFKGVITSSSVLISITVSWLVGVIFGFTPASRAANLDPVECLRSI